MWVNKLNSGLKKSKWFCNDILYDLHLKSLPKFSSGRIILIYHGITKDARTDINARFISTALFEQQIEYFKNQFNIVSLSDYLDGASHPNKLTIALTFDDGYLNNLTEALPILEKHQVPATFFITTIKKSGFEVLWPDMVDLFRLTGPNTFEFKNKVYKKGKHEYVGVNKPLKKYLKDSDWDTKKELVGMILENNNFIDNPIYFPYFKLMNREQINLLSNSKYAEVGAHGLYHNCLNKISITDARIELEESKMYLENIIQKEITSLAYPDGAYNNELVNLAKEVGYRNQFVVVYNSDIDITNPMIEQRFGINPYISFNNQIQSIVDGKY